MNGKAHLSETLRKIMEAQKLTHVEFSEELGISKSALCEYIRGKRNPRLDTLEEISGRLKMSPSELLGGGTPKGRPEIHPMLQAVYEQILQASESLYAWEAHLKGDQEFSLLPHVLSQTSLSSLQEENSGTMFLYVPFEEICYRPEFGNYLSCGIAVFQGKELLMSVSDISTEAKEVVRLADLCSKEQLSPIHFYDVIEDFLSAIF